MGVSRETPYWQNLLTLIYESTYGAALLANKFACFSCVPLGFTSLLCAGWVELKKASVVLICEESFAEQFHLQINDLVPGHAFFAPQPKNDNNSGFSFASESIKHFNESYVYCKKLSPGVLTVSTAALSEHVRNPNENNARVMVRIGENLVVRAVCQQLENWGYNAVDVVSNPGLYAKRGGILDIYPLYAKLPLRIEFFGNKVESVRRFNPISQLSLKTLKQVELLAPSGFSSRSLMPFNKLVQSTFKTFLYIKKDRNGYTVANAPSDPEKGIETKFTIATDLWQRQSTNNVFVFSHRQKLNKKQQKSLKKACFIDRPLETGFVADDLSLTVFGYSDLRMQRLIYSDKSNGQQLRESVFKHPQFSWGEPAVHEDYGVGLYRGFDVLKENNVRRDFIHLEYADGGVVRVPVDRIDKVHKYTSSKKSPVTLSRLGSKTWALQLQSARKAAEETVASLVDLYSKRQTLRGFEYAKDDELMNYLAASFPFKETDGQKIAITETLADMCKKHPMDRVVIGDVGFGKTEVALRAIMKAVVSGKQSFFLVPTTILADQHYITCKSRLGDLGVRVALLSRFKSKKEQAEILSQIATGAVDVVVGTHRLLSTDVTIQNLGLLVVDEEQHFGVKDKERLRTIRSSVDVLTLTATPIPRTLQQSLVGLRDVSAINTPPLERLAIKTTVLSFSWMEIKNKIARELRRGGQIYFLHNKINSLPFFAKKIQSFFPDSQVAVAHGAMSSKDLEQIILSFFKGVVDILICTTIIESGLDVRRANTIIITNAHRFGLAQLYQIRGRVGRGNLQAYCWLMLPKNPINRDAYQRLKVIEHFSTLGSGYQIAIRDLELRGAGSLFGYKQSGYINKIGYDMYCKVLQDAVQSYQGGAEKNMVVNPKIVFSEPAFLPDDYIELIQDRMYYYQRLATANTKTAVTQVAKEMKDRFGTPPKPVENIVAVAGLREQFSGLSVEKIVLNPDHLHFYFKSFGIRSTLTTPVLLKALKSFTFDYHFIPPKNEHDLILSIRQKKELFFVAEAFGKLLKTTIKS